MDEWWNKGEKFELIILLIELALSLFTFILLQSTKVTNGTLNTSSDTLNDTSNGILNDASNGTTGASSKAKSTPPKPRGRKTAAKKKNMPIDENSNEIPEDKDESLAKPQAEGSGARKPRVRFTEEEDRLLVKLICDEFKVEWSKVAQSEWYMI